MSGQGETAQLVETVAGLEQVMGQVAAILEQHGQMLRALLEASAAKPKEATRLEGLIEALIDRMDTQAEVLGRMEARFGQIGAAVEQSVAVLARK